jgi:signal transduction histidine kinase
MTPLSRVEFAGERIAEFLHVLEQMAAGNTSLRLKISAKHDELDAISHGVNVLVGELARITAQAIEAHEERAVITERANVSKNVFLRNLSHQIRTPITAMLGFADVLASNDRLPESRRELFTRLQANAQTVMALLDNLLDLAKLDAHTIVLNPEPVLVTDLVHDVFAGVADESQAKGLDMRVECSRDALGPFRTDRYRLRQILVNLVTNAVKFTAAGRVVVAVNVMHDAEGEPWTIDVTDTGIGIPAERHPYLFAPFEQVNDAIVRVGDGSGLGLALSRRVAEQIGGSLTLLRSVPGEGTTFRLTVRRLPATPTPESASTGATLDAVEDAIQGLRILIAEDHRDLHSAMRQLLEQLGATVESAFDGREAVAKALSGTFDAVLMDLRMPSMDGLQATRVLRSQGCEVPIVALTADSATVWRADALDAGCDACFSKPFDFQEVVAAVRLSPRWGRT